jgi:hypothetical protein
MAPTGKQTSLEQKVQKALDYQEITNVMSKHMFYHAAGKHMEELGRYHATKTPGYRWTHFGEILEGLEGVKGHYIAEDTQTKMQVLQNVARYYPIEARPENMGIGTMILHCQTNPVIEVAGDGKTAKGMWYSPGASAWVGEDGKPQANWTWERYAVDFIKEDDRWKIWHLRIDIDFAIPFGKDFSEHDWPRIQSAPTAYSERARIEDNPYQRYHPTRPLQVRPVPPEPYETFDEKDAY